MQLSVGTNWDRELISVVASIPEVKEVYGCANITQVGTGRPSFILGKVTQEEMPLYIKELHDNGLSFNYTLNAPCLNNLEYNKKAHNELIEHLEWLVSIGIDGVTVSIPYLLELIKKRFPQIKAKVSVIAQVNNVQKARFFEGLGADEIMLDFMINRNFRLLEKIKSSLKCKLSLLLNDFCIFGCPYRYYHYNICGHASQTDHQTNGFYIDYCAIRCTIERLRDPNLLISSRWIRPEDVKCYEEIGYDSFKVSGRRMSTSWIANAANAYSSRTYNGNLSGILDYSLLGMEDDVHSPQYDILIAGAASLKSDALMGLSQFKPERPYIENKALDGLIDFFAKHKCTEDCKMCNHCQKYAVAAVKLDKLESKKQLDVYEALLEELTSSSMFEDNGLPEFLWPDQIARQFDTVLSSIPEAFREAAGVMIKEAANKNASNRGGMEIIEEDMVKALLITTPAFFKDDMLNCLRSLGIDPNQYM